MRHRRQCLLAELDQLESEFGIWDYDAGLKALSVTTESGTPVSEIVRKMEISEATFYRWKQKFDGLGVGEVRRLKQLEEENRKLKQLVADVYRWLPVRGLTPVFVSGLI